MLLLQSPLRVFSQEEADLIYLPIYAALECRLSQAMEGDDHKRAYHARVHTTCAFCKQNQRVFQILLVL